MVVGVNRTNMSLAASSSTTMSGLRSRQNKIPSPPLNRPSSSKKNGGRTHILDEAGVRRELGLSSFSDSADEIDFGLYNQQSLKKKKKKKKVLGTQRSKRIAPKAAQTFMRLSRLPQKNFRVIDLDVATLRPLVDLAYWSTFTEVRRDAAAAFATLAMNEANLQVLSEAGALGAVIALIGMNNDVNDTAIQRDAAIALSFLVCLPDVRSRFIKAPDGLRSVFYICRSSSVDVRRACVNIFMELSRSPETKEALVLSGGVKHLFALAQTTDEVSVRKATQVLKRLAAHGPNHEEIAKDLGAIKAMISLLLDSPDLQIRRDMMSMVSSIASSHSRRELLVERGVLTPLLLHLDPQTSSLETITIVIQCLLGLSSCSEVLKTFLEEGVVETISRVIFDELKEIRTYRAMRFAQHLSNTGGRVGKSTRRLLEISPLQIQATTQDGVENVVSVSENLDAQEREESSEYPTPSSRPSSVSVEQPNNRRSTMMKDTPQLNSSSPTQREAKDQQKKKKQNNSTKVRTMAELEQEALRFGLTILLNLSMQANLRDELVSRELPKLLYEDTILQSIDKRIPRIVAKILSNLAEAEEAGLRHTQLLESGVLHPIRVFLRSKDFHLRTLTLSLAAHLTISSQAKIELGNDLEMLKQFIGFCNIFDEDVNADLAVILARISEEESTFPSLIRARALDALLYMISPRCKHEIAKRESVRALGNLSRDVTIKQAFVQSGALGHLISLSKSGSGLTKMYALETLTALQHDTAAIRIQMVFRGYLARKRFRMIRDVVEQTTILIKKPTVKNKHEPELSNISSSK